MSLDKRSCACGHGCAVNNNSAFLFLQIFERPDLNNAALTSPELAVKRFARTVSHTSLLLLQNGEAHTKTIASDDTELCSCSFK